MSKIYIPLLLKNVAQCLPDRWLRIDAEGSENIPGAGPVLIAARHYHHLYDGLALLRAVPRPVHLLVALDWIQGRTTRRLMMRLTELARWPVVMRRPPERGNLSAREIERILLTGIRAAVQLLTEGSAVAVFPEGYPNIDPHFTPKRTKDEFLPFRDGVTRIASLASRRLREPVPIVPTGFSYHLDSPPKVKVRFGRPLHEKKNEDRSIFVKRLEEEVTRLSR